MYPNNDPPSGCIDLTYMLMIPKILYIILTRVRDYPVASHRR
jgi:hypothetical protein